MTPEQLQALTHSQDGHNILITGQCGTGKTYALKQIICELKKSKNVAITSTTGVASCQLGVGATTLHHWSGIRDGRLTSEELEGKFLLDEQFAEARQRIQSAQCLVIDEVGMLSKVLFEKVELVCRIVKDPKLYFGGLQVIASGDFKQLPPVPNYRYNDAGEYCFLSDVFEKTFPHHFNFKMVVRQNEQVLVEAINQLCNGSPTRETEDFLKSLDRPLPNNDEQDVTYLFGTNFDTEYTNIEKLDEKIPGAPTYLKSIDTGRVTLLNDCGAQKILTLKISAPVMLLRNLAQRLYNGCIGKVHDIDEDKVTVNFDGQLVPIGRCIFEVYDPPSKTVLASRLQFPLRLAYAMTVHRAQGQSLPLVEIDCFSFFAPGQMGVAVGRAMTIEGLRIVNYNSNAALLKHSTEVYDFYDLPSQKPDVSLQCCKQSYNLVREDEDEDEDFDFLFDDIDDIQMDQQDIDAEAELTNQPRKQTCDYAISSFLDQYNGNKDQLSACLPKLKTLQINLYGHVKGVLKKQPKSSSDFTTLFKNVNAFLISDTHLEIYEQMFRNTELDHAVANRISSSLFRWLLEKEIEKRANKIVNDKEEEINSNIGLQEQTEVGSSKLRYIAGACLFKSVKILKSTVINKLTKKGKKSKIDRRLAYKKQQLLSKLRVSEEEITLSSELPTSLNELKMRQGEGKHLFFVSDDVFSFFISLNRKLQCHLSDDAFHCYGKYIHQKCKILIKSDANLVKEWCDLFSENDTDDDSEGGLEMFTAMLLDLYEMVSTYFIKVALVNSLKRFKSTIPKTKKQALRSNIHALTENNKSSNKKRKQSEISASSQEPVFVCPTCRINIIENPETYEDQSIGCDFCNDWYHYKCVSIKGNENCLKNNSKWKCPSCRESTRKKKR